MCTNGHCETCEQTDEWLVPAELHPPKPTLGRDGGEPKEKS